MSKNFKVKNGLETTNITSSGEINAGRAQLGEFTLAGMGDLNTGTQLNTSNVFISPAGDGFVFKGDETTAFPSFTAYSDSNPMFAFLGLNSVQDGNAIAEFNPGDSSIGTSTYGPIQSFIFQVRGGTVGKVNQGSASFDPSFGTNENDIMRISSTYFSGSTLQTSSPTTGLSLVTTGSTLPAPLPGKATTTTSDVNDLIQFIPTGSSTADYLNIVANKINELNSFVNITDRSLGLIARTGSDNGLQITSSHLDNAVSFTTGSVAASTANADKFIAHSSGKSFELSGQSKRSVLLLQTVENEKK